MEATPSQLAWFRLRRSGLVDPFATADQVARRLVGVQAQLGPAASLAIRNRTAAISLDELDRARNVERSLVRFWGQRNTVHLYHADDWPWLQTAFAPLQTALHRKLRGQGLLADFRRVATRIRKRLERGDRLRYEDVRSKKLSEAQDRWVVSYAVFMELVRQGVACHGPDDGGSTFVHREHWLPDLPWSPPDADDAHRELARRYLAAYGPAEPRDLAFWFGGTVTEARRWLESTGEDCRAVEVDGRTLWCRTEDLEALTTAPPRASRWPVHLLYRFDPLLLAHKDKSWLVDDAHYKQVWRAAAHVEAVLLVRGRIAGTWRYDRRRTGLEVRVRPFAPLPATVERAVRARARTIAAFLGIELASLEID